MQQPKGDTKNLIVALVLSVVILMAWQMLYENPRRLAEAERMKSQQQNSTQVQVNAQGQPINPEAPATLQTREEIIAQGGRVKINTPSLHGSISLKGARIDDLTLVKYRTTVAKDSPEVVLLSPSGNEHAYFAQTGWIAKDSAVKVPDENSVWTASGTELSPGKPLTLRWDNGQGQQFEVTYTVDERYMFTIAQNVRNNSGHAITLLPYGFLNRAYPTVKDQYAILHEGPLGVMQGKLDEIHYKTLREEPKKVFDNSRGWLGITDKYWLAALIPSQDGSFTATFSHYTSNGMDRYQTDYMGQGIAIDAGATGSTTTRLFAGAKEVTQLDAYAAQYNIPLFDRAVDFGVLYFLTKPLFSALNFIYLHIGNFGIAILVLTVCVRLCLFPLANKSYASMAQMKKLHPQMQELRELHKDDKMKMNQKVIELYKREKVNPMSGCLPMLIQLPVFFALYKVLFVTIEMRHAPFYGWIHDLSAPDPTNIFTLFGLLAWNPPAIMHVGIWPILMSVTMFIQMQMNPPPADPIQAKVMKMLPLIFLFLFSSFPAGLVIYWTWGNILSIGQQYIIARKYNPKTPKEQVKEA